MLRGWNSFRPLWATLIALTLSLTVACGPDEEALAAAARTEEWTALQTMKAELSQQRAEVAEMRAQRAAGPAEGEEPWTEEAKAELESAYDNADFQVQKLSDAFVTRLVAFINDDPMEQGAEPTESQRAAFRLKASEDLVLADEYGDAGGDWARAIAIAQEALRIDPENTEVLDRVAYYESMRYMTEERLALAEVGMTLAEVEAAVGIPSRGNDREFEGGTRRAFYYLKSAERDAAAVYFQKRGEVWTAYKVDFNALEANS